MCHEMLRWKAGDIQRRLLSFRAQSILKGGNNDENADTEQA